MKILLKKIQISLRKRQRPLNSFSRRDEFSRRWKIRLKSVEKFDSGLKMY